MTKGGVTKRKSINLSNTFINHEHTNVATITLFSGNDSEHTSAVINGSDSVSALLLSASQKARLMYVTGKTIDLIQFEVVEEYTEGK